MRPSATLPQWMTVAVSGVVGMLMGLWMQQRIRKHYLTTSCRSIQAKNPSKVKEEMERHILETQTPAKALGIRVHSIYEPSTNHVDVDTGSDHHENRWFLELSAPLHLNTNVHGTAFAGSLYSVAVLASYYLARHWLFLQPQSQSSSIRWSDYTLVAKAANIRYRRPVHSPLIIARSILPSPGTMKGFVEELVKKGKATVDVGGVIYQQDTSSKSTKPSSYLEVVACEYSVEVCAYLPRSSNE